MKKIELTENEVNTLETILNFADLYIKNLMPKTKEQKKEFIELRNSINDFENKLNNR